MTIRPRLRRWARKTYRALCHPRHRRGGGLRGWLSRRVFAKELWRPARREMSVGVASGAFVSVFPGLGQTVLASALCMIARGNIPGAILATWVGNPVTWVWFAPHQFELGRIIMSPVVNQPPPDLIVEGQRFPHFIAFSQLQAWFLGTVITGLVLAMIGYAITHALWPLVSKPVAKGVAKVKNVTQRIPRARPQPSTEDETLQVRTASVPKPPDPLPSTRSRAQSAEVEDRFPSPSAEGVSSEDRDEPARGPRPITPPPKGAPRRDPTET